jgi:aerotaxis receptor
MASITIKQRLWIWATVSMVTFLVAIVLGWISLGAARDSLKTVHEDRMLPAIQLSDIQTLMLENQRHVLLAYQHDPAGAMLAAHGHPISMHFDVVKANSAKIAQVWKTYMATYLTEQEKVLIADFETKQNAWVAKLNGAISGLEQGDFSARSMALYIQLMNGEGKAAMAALDELKHYQGEVASDEFRAAESSYNTARTTFVILFLIAIMVSAWAGIATLSRITHGFATAQSVARAIADGDLTRTVQADGGDEIGQLLASMATMRDNLNEMVGDLRTNIDRLSSESRELRGAAGNVSATAGQQSEAASSMAAAVEQLSVSIDTVEENAVDARHITQDSSSRSDQSAHVIRQAIEEMHRIAQSVTDTAANIRDLEGEAGRITDIVNVIKDIADQTNLLALNAAIEAARAGEQGRGFAVVADEVRKLAERTSQATIEITGMIGKIQDGAKGAAIGMENGVSRVKAGVELASRAGGEVAQMQEAGGRIAEAVDAISLALREQSAATRQIAGRVENVSQGTEEMAASARQTSNSAEELEQLAENLARIAGKFRVA